MAVLPFMGDAPTQQEDERIVKDLLAQLKASSPAPQQRPRPNVFQSIVGTASDALMNRARVMAGGLPQQGAFQQELQRLQQEDEADQRDYLKSQRDIDTRVRIGVAEGKLREMADMRAENRQNLRVISEEQRAAKRAQEQRQQAFEDALNNKIIERGAADEVAGDFRKKSFEERVKMLSSTMGARTPMEAYEQFINSGLSDRFRVKSIESFADGTFAPTIEPIEGGKEDRAGNQKMIEQLAAAGVPRDQLIERALALGVDENIAGVLGDLSDNVNRGNTIKAKAQALDDLATLVMDKDPDLAADIAELRGFVEGDAPYEDVTVFYDHVVDGAMKAIEAYEKNPQDPEGMTRERAAKHLQDMRRLIRQYTGYEMPDAAIRPPKTSAPEGGEEKPAKGEGGGLVSGAAKGLGRFAKDLATGEVGKQLFPSRPKKPVKDMGSARIKK